MGKKLKEDTPMCENKEFAMDKQELADDLLEQVAGGTAPDWAASSCLSMANSLFSHIVVSSFSFLPIDTI